MSKKKKKPIREGKPNAAEIHPGSTVQGGSNFGQGSSQLGKQAIKQGEEKNDGANYANETGWNNEALRTSDLEESGEKRP